VRDKGGLTRQGCDDDLAERGIIIDQNDAEMFVG